VQLHGGPSRNYGRKTHCGRSRRLPV
jgi:hypothetical protein